MPRQTEELEKEKSYAVRKSHADLIYQMDLGKMLTHSSDLAPRLLKHSKATMDAAENSINKLSQKRQSQKKDLAEALASLRKAHGSLELAYSYSSGQNGNLHPKATELYKNILAVKCLLGPGMHLLAMTALESKARMPLTKE